MLPMSDIALIINAISLGTDHLKVYFGVKALKNILLVATPRVIGQIMERFNSRRLINRLVRILTYEHITDAVMETLHVIALMTNIYDPEVTSFFVSAGLIFELSRFIDHMISEQTSEELAVLSL